MSSEFACIPGIPYTMHPVKKSPVNFFDRDFGVKNGGPKRAMASCGETVDQNAKMDSKTFSTDPKVYTCFTSKPQGVDSKQTLQKDAFGRPFPRTTHSPLLWRTMNVGPQSFCLLFSSALCGCCQDVLLGRQDQEENEGCRRETGAIGHTVVLAQKRCSLWGL